jgi:hypothetical protein
MQRKHKIPQTMGKFWVLSRIVSATEFLYHIYWKFVSVIYSAIYCTMYHENIDNIPTLSIANSVEPKIIKHESGVQNKNTVFCRPAGGSMYGPGRGRALSLVHIPDTEAGEGDILTATGGMTPAISEPDLRRHLDDDVEQGISLLIAGSPIDDTLVADDALLDYESDEGSTPKHSVVPSEAAPAAMDTECIAPADATAGPSSSRNSTVPDAMFYQCRASRLSSFRDTLVSISSDTTFGEKN